jgi:hypothetical protein
MAKVRSVLYESFSRDMAMIFLKACLNWFLSRYLSVFSPEVSSLGPTSITLYRHRRIPCTSTVLLHNLSKCQSTRLQSSSEPLAKPPWASPLPNLRQRLTLQSVSSDMSWMCGGGHITGSHASPHCKLPDTMSVPVCTHAYLPNETLGSDTLVDPRPGQCCTTFASHTLIGQLPQITVRRPWRRTYQVLINDHLAIFWKRLSIC